MTAPVERLQAAIERIEALQAASHNWRVQLSGEEGPEVIHDFDTDGHGPGTGTLAWTCSPESAINMVTLHRTIDAQLAILRFGLQRQSAVDWTRRTFTANDKQLEAAGLEVALADAILGHSPAPALSESELADVARFGIHPELTTAEDW